MSHPKSPLPVLYFVAITGREIDIWKESLEILNRYIGKIFLQSSIFNFSEFTDYYEKEMGKNLKKAIFFFKDLKSPEFLVELKHICYEIERKFADGKGNRKINLDPGYIELSKVVLSTFKNYSHRIYLGKGVYAEVTLIYKNKTFNPLSWTYPDYTQREIIEIFNKAREEYKKVLNAYR